MQDDPSTSSGQAKKELEKKIEKQEFKTFLSGKYDKNNAILEIYSGAGGGMRPTFYFGGEGGMGGEG